MKILFLTLILAISVQSYEDEDLVYGNFPDGFVWGTATSAYQIEGGWNEGGKGVSIWDVFTSNPGTIADGSSGNIACDSYHKYKEDVQLIVNLNVTHYRFSIAWSRIFPSGVGETENEEGILYYNNLIDELKRNNIEPVVTLYHWDLPQALQAQGGWLNADIATWFEAYARACFTNFGDRVKFWITLNEPFIVAHLGYGLGTFAPGIVGPGTTNYVAAHNELRAHAKAYRLYEREFKVQQGGVIGITLNGGWPTPEDDSPSNANAAERSLQFDFGWFANPIFSENGDYPQVMKEKIAEKSQLQGYEKSRLPEFTAEEIAELKGSSDFFGLNFYNGYMVADSQSDINDISFDADKDVRTYPDPTWYSSGSPWLKVTPFAMRGILNWIKDTYNNPEIYITENGVSDKAGNIDDFLRTYFYKHYINNVLKATMDGVNVKGYYAWSLMDNFEWTAGYTEKFGLYSVDFTDPTLPRRPKKSTELYSAIIRNNGFVEGLVPCE